MKAKVWLIGWLVIVISALSVFGYWVYRIDPFFHYHKPDTNRYFYKLNNHRSQNDGIIKHFDYDAIITGTSMIENFKTSDVNERFDCNSIKLPYPGAYYKENSDAIRMALRLKDDFKLAVFGLDMNKFAIKYDAVRNEQGTYPTYLYDNNVFNDVNYVLNRDVIFNRCYEMTENSKNGIKGITSFDDYSSWGAKFEFGRKSICPDGVVRKKNIKKKSLSEAEKEVIKKNISSNLTEFVDEHPDVEFYYFYTPYSAAWYNDLINEGTLDKQFEIEKYVTELLLQHENIHLFSFNNRYDITTNLNNYKDKIHYGAWINNLMMKWMSDGTYQLTAENYEEIIQKDYDFYTSFDYLSLNEQEDHEADLYAAALMNEELTGIKPLDVLNDGSVDAVVNETVKFDVDLDDGYNYLCFSAQKRRNKGSLTACVYDEDGTAVGQIETDHKDLDNKVHQYVIDLSAVSGKITIVLKGDLEDSAGSSDSDYRFSNIYMY